MKKGGYENMKQWKKLVAVAVVCAALFAGCADTNKPKEETPDAPETVTTQAQPQDKEDTAEPEKAEDAKAALVEKAQEDKEAILAAFQEVIDNYKADTAPEYYAAFPDEEDYPDLSSVDGMEIVKGDSTCDVQAYVNLGGNSVNKLCISLKYIEAPAESASNWMVVATSIATQK